MNYYQELIELLRNGEYIVFEAGGTKQRQVTKYGQIVVDIIEQLVKERDAAVKCIEDIETYFQMGSAKYIGKTIKEWRGVQE